MGLAANTQGLQPIKKSMYESDNNTNPGEMYSTSTSSNIPQFKKFNPDKPLDDKRPKKV